MYLTDLTDAQKEYIKGTILMDNWWSKANMIFSHT